MTAVSGSQVEHFVLLIDRATNTLVQETEHEIQGLVIQGIVNLLRANSEIGTAPCLELAVGDTADAESCYIACVLFTQVLHKGTKLERAAGVSAPKKYENALCEVKPISRPRALC
jgi:hypothetical protein